MVATVTALFWRRRVVYSVYRTRVSLRSAPYFYRRCEEEQFRPRRRGALGFSKMAASSKKKPEQFWRQFTAHTHFERLKAPKSTFTMNSKVTPNELLSQVNQFWSLLDDMAENSPDSYQTFIQRHMNEGKDFMKPPEPFLCIQTKILLPEERLLFVNICGWKRVPAPQSDSDPVPLIAGKLQDTSEGTVIDIAYSPVVLKGAESDRVEQDQLVHLAMKCIEQQHKVTLCHSFHITPFRQKGNLQTLTNNLDGQQKKPKPTKEKSQKASNTSLLEQLKNISVSAEEKEKPSPHIQIMKESDPKPGEAGLIEVISSTELNEEDLLSTPQHELSIVNNLSGKPQKIILTAALHGVRSVTECDLSVSKDDLMLEVPGKYRLLLNLPVLVNEDSTTATYNKANDTLTVTMLVEDNQGVQ